MIEIAFGRPGNGKTLYTMRKILWLLKRAEKIDAKFGLERHVWVNVPLAEWVRKRYAKYLRFWDDPYAFIEQKGIDIVYDEIAVDFGASSWASTPRDLKTFWSQHRHLGNEIYGNTQDYLDIDISIRRRVARALQLRKMIGSPDPSPTLPKINTVWGWIIGRTVDPQQAEDNKKIDMSIIEKIIPTESFMITKELCSMYDTEYCVKHHVFPLRHEERICPDCGFRKLSHS